jgi:hypothetical protein
MQDKAKIAVVWAFVSRAAGFEAGSPWDERGSVFDDSTEGRSCHPKARKPAAHCVRSAAANSVQASRTMHLRTIDRA